MRKAAVTLLLVLLSVWAVGCGPTEPASKGTTKGQSQATEGDTAAKPAGIKAIQPRTEREKAALESAASDTGRKWAMGNPDGSTGSAVGDPFLVGYQVQFANDKTVDSVIVIDGRVASFFGAQSQTEPSPQQAVVSGTYDISTANYVEPQGTAQKAAFDAARDYLTKNGYETAKGGIEGIVILFPRVEGDGQFAGQDPGVTLFANPAIGGFAAGGPAVRY